MTEEVTCEGIGMQVSSEQVMVLVMEIIVIVVCSFGDTVVPVSGGASVLAGVSLLVMVVSV